MGISDKVFVEICSYRKDTFHEKEITDCNYDNVSCYGRLWQGRYQS